MTGSRDVRGALGAWLVSEIVREHGVADLVARRIVLQVLTAVGADIRRAADAVGGGKHPAHRDFADAVRMVAVRLEHAADRVGGRRAATDERAKDA